MNEPDVIVVGAGLAGLSGEKAANVYLFKSDTRLRASRGKKRGRGGTRLYKKKQKLQKS